MDSRMGSNLFKVEVAGSEELNEAVTFIHRCRRILWPVIQADPKSVKSERDVMLDITSEILVLGGIPLRSTGTFLPHLRSCNSTAVSYTLLA